MCLEIGGQAAHIFSKPFIQDDINGFSKQLQSRPDGLMR
jgi:hypothetical protein